MNIFRKCYTPDLYGNTIARDLNSIGFNYVNGKNINPNHTWAEAFYPAEDTAQAYFDKSIKWKYDSASDLNSITHLFLHSSQTFTDFYRADGSVASHYNDSIIISKPGQRDYPKIIFIPLINNGFIFLCNHIDNGIYSTTPKILSYHEAKNLQNSYGMLIGFKSQIYKNNPYTYIYRSLSTYYDNIEDPSFAGGEYKEYSLTLSLNNYCNNGTTIRENSIYLSTYIDKSQDLLYTDTNTNICTLVKMPIFSTYLDNVFICTTSPFVDGIEGKTFSFGGRNFIGLYNNLALELPKN